MRTAGHEPTVLMIRGTSMATILIDKNVMVPMRDGVRLATDVYRLEGAPPEPVLLARTPYDKEHIIAASNAFDILRAVQAGYVVVIQDVRGRFASEGEFNPQFQEGRDGVDTIAWTVAQPWSRGIVGTFGGSYLGCTQWLAAREQPQALRVMAPMVTPSDMYEGESYQGGANVFHSLRWAVSISRDEIPRRVARGWVPPEGRADLDVNTVLAHLPLNDHPLLHDLVPFWGDWLAHPVLATSRSMPRRSTSVGGTISFCGARSRTTRVCESLEERHTRVRTSAWSLVPGATRTLPAVSQNASSAQPEASTRLT